MDSRNEEAIKAYITSIGEPTTDLCEWSLKRLGFDTHIVYNETSSLGDKLEYIYGLADDDFIRVDADVIVNKELRRMVDIAKAYSWVQFQTFDMYKLDITNGGVQYINKEILPTLRANINRFKHDNRPETRMFRLEEFSDRKRFKSAENVVGIHGFGQTDWERVKKTKDSRQYSNEFDWELVKRMQEFYV